ncbi:MAG: Ig-like domain-containing protein [Bacteroidales bacterium]|nr:Ig-like domain-containing protein [Bacteroidales bacterium]
MKKNLSYLIAVLVVFSLVFVSCGNNDDNSISPTGVRLNQTIAALTIGDSLTLRVTILPENATNRNVAWVSNNTAIATVTDGVVIAIDTGTADIVVTTVDSYRTDTTVIEVVLGWATSLGRASFATSQIWEISNDSISQIWSDAVQTDSCRHKMAFSGWSAGTYNVDCRSNPDQRGTLFSWQAVYELKEELCPYPWRVPTREDFRDLDIAMGGTGAFRTDPGFVNTNYINLWGGTFGGACNTSGALFSQGTWAYYWSQSSDSADGGFLLRFSSTGTINPQHWGSKFNGFSLRCVQ